MCAASQDVMNKLDVTVRQFLNEGRMFTAYDVTIETRSREKMNLKHSDLKGSVHEVQSLVDALDYGFDQDSGSTIRYGRTQVSMPNGSWSFVYHPVGADPKSYQARNSAAPVVNSLSVAAPVVNSLSVASTTDSGGETDDGTFVSDLRNRLLVPTRFLKEAGAKPTKPVFVYADHLNNTISLAVDSRAIVSATMAKIASIPTQVVERNGDVRLSSKTLRAADMEGTEYNIGVKEVTVGVDKFKVVEITPVD